MSTETLEITVHVIPSKELLPEERRKVEAQLRFLLARTGVVYELWFYPHRSPLPELGPAPDDRIRSHG